MHRFKDFGITPPASKSFVGDKIKIDKILNREITVFAYRIEDSKHVANSDCLHLQIEFKNEKHVVFTGSNVLMETIKKVPKEKFPFVTTIVK